MQTLLKTTGAYKLLQREGEGEGFSHAYLLLFEDGENLRLALKTFAKLFFGCDRPTTPAQKRVSDLLDGESFADCVCYPAAGKKLVVEDAEKILEESTLAPVEGEKKLFIIGDFSEANVQTQNKLLKLLEEPPKGVYFLLGATSVFSVLTTVQSRTKKLEIQPFSVAEVTSCLQRKYGEKYDDETLSVCAATSGGSVGDASKLLEGGYYQGLVENAFALTMLPSYKLPAMIKQAGETTRKKELLSLLRLIYRDALLIKTVGEKGLMLPSKIEQIEEVSKKYSTQALLYAQSAVSEAEKQVQFNAVFPQCLQICIANISRENERTKI